MVSSTEDRKWVAVPEFGRSEFISGRQPNMVLQRKNLLFRVLCVILATLVTVAALNRLVGGRVSWAAKQRQAILWVESLGGTVEYSDDHRRRDQAPYVDRLLAPLGVDLGLTADSVSLQGTAVTDLSPLIDLTDLKSLNLADIQVSDLSALAGLDTLERLYLDQSAVRDLSPLAGLRSLQDLSLSGTSVSDLTPLAGLTDLARLDVSSTQVHDLAPLAKLTKLNRLVCSNTQVSDLNPLSGLIALNQLNCSKTQVGDLTPLAKLTQLYELDCSDTQVSDVSGLSGSNVISLRLSGSRMTDLSSLSGLRRLKVLLLNRTDVADLSPLRQLPQLLAVRVMDTPVTDEEIARLQAALPKCTISRQPDEFTGEQRSE